MQTTSKATHIKIAVVAALLIVLVGALLMLFFIQLGWKTFNTLDNIVQRVDTVTSDENRKTVEDTAKAMIASYEADVLTYNQYKDSLDKEKQELAEQAKKRANQTANAYDNFIYENSFVWLDGLPDGVRSTLPSIQ